MGKINYLEQFNPPENCLILILDNYSMRYICEGDKYYEEQRLKET